jgi:integrase/recombinase XerD
MQDNDGYPVLVTEIVPAAVPTGVLAHPDGDAGVDRHLAGWLLGFRSAHTRRSYARDLRGFLGWLHLHTGADTDTVDTTVLLGVDRGTVHAYARHLEATGAAASSVARALSALSSLFTYLTIEEVISTSPCTHVRRPTVASDSQTTGLDRDQARALLARARADSPRAYALLAILTGNGLRVGEILAADTGDLDVERGHRVLRITRKGGKRATVVLAPPVADAVDLYLDGRTTGPLFTTRTGRRLDEPYLFRLVRRLAREAGIATADRLSPHSLRHTFVTLALDAGVPLHDVQDAAGHADPRTTQRYNRARHNLDRHPAYRLAAHLA